MKFAIPLAEGKLTAHFGHCQEFALVKVEDNQIKSKETLVPPPPEELVKQYLDNTLQTAGNVCDH